MHQRFLPLLLLIGLSCANTNDERKPETESGKPTAGAPDFSSELTSESARKLIPPAASLSQAELLAILEKPPVRIDEIPNQSLTALLLAIDPSTAELVDPRTRLEFRYLNTDNSAPGRKLIDAVLGPEDVKYASIIHEDYITDCRCETRGETAEGRVDFRAEKIYAGSAEFTAKKTDRGWQIVAFHLPAYQLKTTMENSTTWKLTSEENLLGVYVP